MDRRQEVCRDFLRGNCRYGARCKYLHQTPQQQRSQQQKNDFGGGGNYYKALGNNTNNLTQSQSKEHRCNDFRVCKEQIKEDFASEVPLWRLTCYAHHKFAPNDIVGDVSPEELRALAYEGAKQGLSLKDLAQREASVVAAKNAEFDALLRNPYKGSAAQNSSAFQFNPFSSSPFLSPPKKDGMFMPFGQSATLSTPSPPEVFAQIPFGGTPTNSFNFGQPSGNVQFGKLATGLSGGNSSPFGQQTLPGGNPSPFGQQTLSGGNPSPFGQQTNLFQQSPFQVITSPSPAQQSLSSNLQGPNTALNANVFQSPVIAPLSTGGVAHSSTFLSTFGSPASFISLQGLNPAVNMPASISQAHPGTPSLQAVPVKAEVDAIWLQDVWKIGEIPEGEPPPEVRV